MVLEHHDLDVYPIPRDKAPRFINEPWLIDLTLLDYGNGSKEPDLAKDNIRIYVPIDLNKEAILRRLDYIIYEYVGASEENESNYRSRVYQLISQIEIYDQIWYVRHIPKEGKHSEEAKLLVREFVDRLKEISDCCAELFPFEQIEELEKEFLQ